MPMLYAMLRNMTRSEIQPDVLACECQLKPLSEAH